MRLVILESPYAATDQYDLARNIAYGRKAVRDCLDRKEAPVASHLLYTLPGVLDDTKREERELGIEAGLAWGLKADATVVYVDRGLSEGMRRGVERAKSEGRPVEFRSLVRPHVDPAQFNEIGA